MENLTGGTPPVRYLPCVVPCKLYFTEDEAQYAVDNVDADWNVNALEKAREYQEMMSMSNDAIFEQLTSEYGEKFTKEEAQYAIDNLN